MDTRGPEMAYAEYEARLAQLRTELAATQLQLKEAREALGTCETSARYLDPCMQWQGGVQSFNSAKVKAALSRPADTTALNRAMERAFDKGWIMSAKWHGQDHLLADMDSDVYKKERADELENTK